VVLRGLPLATLALAAGLCGGEAPVALLETEKRELIAATVEKKDFWAEVERKGALAKRLKELQGEELELQQQLAPSLEPAREVNRRADEVKAEIQRREAELAARIAELERTLEAWRKASRAEEAG
jgi:hypothetical protein